MSVPPGSPLLTICEGLEAHLAAVFAKARHGARSHLHHVDGARPQADHPGRVGLAALYSGVDLGVVLQRDTHTETSVDRKSVV